MGFVSPGDGAGGAAGAGERGAAVLAGARAVWGCSGSMPVARYRVVGRDCGAALAISLLLVGVSAGLLALLRRLERNWQVS